MVFQCYAGFREDNGQLVEAFLHEQNSTPTTRLRTEDDVRVRGEYLFDLNVSVHSVFAVQATHTLARALCVLIKTGLTAEQERALALQAPAINLTPR